MATVSKALIPVPIARPSGDDDFDPRALKGDNFVSISADEERQVLERFTELNGAAPQKRTCRKVAICLAQGMTLRQAAAQLKLDIGIVRRAWSHVAVAGGFHSVAAFRLDCAGATDAQSVTDLLKWRAL